ncbi:hypothetical protein JG688_00015643 [Phytophthora aleatoria]|uniref:Uncharacterized protein n=1 Tax=Phytophthora aleatoria TaxID=2496075 RepID=A0A8J5IFD8_9STRA|nr:hypothetical protein JG688_00015643 [Phytophthora aleatoria]
MDVGAAKGYSEIVQALSTNRTEGCTTPAMDGAAQIGHLDVVEWLHANRSEGCTTSAMDEAASNRFWDVVDWLAQNRSEGGTAATMAACASQGDIERVYWCHYIGPTPCDVTASQCAVLNSHDKIAWFLHQFRQWNPCDVFHTLTERFDLNRRWEFAEWLYSHVKSPG